MSIYTDALQREKERQHRENTPLEEGIYRATIADVKEKYDVPIGDKICDQLEIHFYLENGLRTFQRYFPSLKPDSKFYNLIMNLFGEIPSDLESSRLISKKCRVKVEHTYLKSGKPWNAVTEVFPLMTIPMVQAQPVEDMIPVDEYDYTNPYDNICEEESHDDNHNHDSDDTNIYDMIDESETIYKDETMDTYDDNDCWPLYEENGGESTKNISAKIVTPPPKRMKKIAPRIVG